MDWTSYTDGQLASAFAEGGANEPFEELVRRHGPMVHRTCRRVMGNHANAEDAAQMVFTALAASSGELADYRSLGGWLYSTAWHIARHMMRSDAARGKRESRALRPGPTDMNGEPDDSALQELYRALEMLPPDYRDVIVLHHLQGMTIEQVADVLAANSGTIASRLSRGRAMIRERLSKREVLWSAAIVSWTLSAEWTTDHAAAPEIFIPDQAQVTAFLASPPPRLGLLPMATKLSAGAAAAGATWTAGKFAVAACASVVAFGAMSVGVSQIIDHSRPKVTTLRATGSASASAENSAAGSEDAEVASKVSRSYSPAVTSVPEPTVLPAIAVGLLALRRRRKSL